MWLIDVLRILIQFTLTHQVDLFGRALACGSLLGGLGVVVHGFSRRTTLFITSPNLQHL